MRFQGRKALSIVEALVAIVVLSIGILAFAGSAALTSRMVGLGALSTRAALLAATRIERLRHIAFSTVPACVAPEWRSDSAGGAALAESWELLDAAGSLRRVRLVVRSRHPLGASSDTVLTGFLCGQP